MKLRSLGLTSRNGRERGATLTEYGVMVAFVAIIAIAGTRFLGYETGDTLCGVGGYIEKNQLNEIEGRWLTDWHLVDGREYRNNVNEDGCILHSMGSDGDNGDGWGWGL